MMAVPYLAGGKPSAKNTRQRESRLLPLPILPLWTDLDNELNVISHCRNEEEQPLNYRFSSLECEQILAADSQLPLAPLVSARRCSIIDHTLHFLHAPQCGIVAQV